MRGFASIMASECLCVPWYSPDARLQPAGVSCRHCHAREQGRMLRSWNWAGASWWLSRLVGLKIESPGVHFQAPNNGEISAIIAIQW